MRLKGQVALVTGASRGIGRAIALEMALQGAFVIGTATTEAGALTIAQSLKAISAESGIGKVLDVNDGVAVRSLISSIDNLSILINNAGITKDQLALRMKDEEWDAVIATNLSAVSCLCRAVLKGMIKARHGRIVNITSVVGSIGNLGQVNYAAAKAGVEGMTRALAREVASRNITVNAVAPGFIDTDMTSCLPQQQKDALLQQIPLGRLGVPEEIAATVAFLVSPEAGYITGTTVHVNGGMYMG